ncbi:AMP-binding protein [Streptomyces albogriseolus]|nr:AMP-binding protein [Streptomyces albogriseolus]
MRIVDERGTVLTEGEAGRFQVRGTSVTGGYHDNPAANAEAFTDDGWFDTGDLAFLRDGELYITGRAKDVIIVNGVNHYSHEIEACVEELPYAERSFTAAVAVRTDPSSPTDELALFLHLTPEATADPARALREIAGKVTREIGVSPSFLIPVARDAVPKTEIGKIQRTRLRKGFEAGDFDDEVRRTQLLLGTAATVPDWFLRPVWQRAERVGTRPTASGRHTLVLAGGDPQAGALAQRLADALRSAGGLCTVVGEGPSYTRTDAAHYRVRLAEESDYAALLGRLEQDHRPVDAVLHLDGFRAGSPAAPDDTTGAERLLAFVRALIARPGRAAPRGPGPRVRGRPRRPPRRPPQPGPRPGRSAAQVAGRGVRLAADPAPRPATGRRHRPADPPDGGGGRRRGRRGRGVPRRTALRTPPRPPARQPDPRRAARARRLHPAHRRPRRRRHRDRRPPAAHPGHPAARPRAHPGGRGPRPAAAA